MLFGLIATLIIFSLFCFMTYGLTRIADMQKYDMDTSLWSPFSIRMMEILLISSLLCSSDVFTTISMIKYEE